MLPRYHGVGVRILQRDVALLFKNGTGDRLTITADKVARWQVAQRKEEGFWRRRDVLDEQQQRVLSRYRPVIAELSGELPEGAAVLDIGCGPTCAGRLFTASTRVFLDPLMDTYREVYGDQLPTGELLCARAEEIPKRDRSFDVVISVNSLDHMIDPDTVLSEVSRVLRPDGVFLLGLFLHPPPIAAIRRLVDRLLASAREDAHPYSYTRGSCRALLLRHFEIQREIPVFRRGGALARSLHREDRLFVCRLSS